MEKTTPKYGNQAGWQWDNILNLSPTTIFHYQCNVNSKPSFCVGNNTAISLWGLGLFILCAHTHLQCTRIKWDHQLGADVIINGATYMYIRRMYLTTCGSYNHPILISPWTCGKNSQTDKQTDPLYYVGLSNQAGVVFFPMRQTFTHIKYLCASSHPIITS